MSIRSVGRTAFELIYYSVMRDYHRKPIDQYNAFNVKFPAIKRSHIPHIMFPTEVSKKGSIVGNRHLYLFFKTIITTVELYPKFFEDIDPLDVIWSEKQKKYTKQDRCLIVEHGWLPRSSYQVNSIGANGRAAPANDVNYMKLIGGESILRKKLEYLSEIYTNPKRQQYDNLLSNDDYIVVPLQTGDDLNLRDSMTEFSKCYGLENSTRIFAEMLIEYVTELDLPYRVVFTQHPTDREENLLNLRSRDIFCSSKSGISTMELIQGVHCVGVLSVNSNTVHEALCLNVPCCVLGRLFWRTQSESPFSNDPVSFFSRDSIAKPMECQNILKYLAKLLCYQWNLSDFQNPCIVREIVRSSDDQIPFIARKEFSFY